MEEKETIDNNTESSEPTSEEVTGTETTETEDPEQVVEGEETTEEETTETGTTTTQGQEDENVDVLFVEPTPVTTYQTESYEIDIVHSITLGDFLTSTLIAMLIVVTLLSRIIGR